MKETGGGVILESSSPSSHEEQEDSEQNNAEDTSNISENGSKGLLVCDGCEFQQPIEETTRYPGDACPECWDYLSEV